MGMTSDNESIAFEEEAYDSHPTTPAQHDVAAVSATNAPRGAATALPRPPLHTGPKHSILTLPTPTHRARPRRTATAHDSSDDESIRFLAESSLGEIGSKGRGVQTGNALVHPTPSLPRGGSVNSVHSIPFHLEDDPVAHPLGSVTNHSIAFHLEELPPSVTETPHHDHPTPHSKPVHGTNNTTPPPVTHSNKIVHAHSLPPTPRHASPSRATPDPAVLSTRSIDFQLDDATERSGHDEIHHSATEADAAVRKTVVTNRLRRPSSTTIAPHAPATPRRSVSAASTSSDVPLPGVSPKPDGTTRGDGAESTRRNSTHAERRPALRAISASTPRRHDRERPRTASVPVHTTTGTRTRTSVELPRSAAHEVMTPLSARSDTASRYRGTDGTATREASHDVPHVERTARPTHTRSALRGKPRRTHSVITRAIVRRLAEQEGRVRTTDISVPAPTLAALSKVYPELQPCDDEDENTAGPEPERSPLPHPRDGAVVVASHAVVRPRDSLPAVRDDDVVLGDCAAALRQTRDEAAQWHRYNVEQRAELARLQTRIAQAVREDCTLLQSVCDATRTRDDGVRRSAASQTVARTAPVPHRRRTATQHYAALQLRSPQTSVPQPTTITTSVAPTSDGAYNMAASAAAVASMLGLLWPPSRPSELFFLTGTRLTAAQVRRFYEAVREHHAAQTSPRMAAVSEAEQNVHTMRAASHNAASSRAVPSLRACSSTWTKRPAPSRRATQKGRAVRRTSVLRAVFDLLDVTHRGVLEGADLPTLKLLAEKELATLGHASPSSSWVSGPTNSVASHVMATPDTTLVHRARSPGGSRAVLHAAEKGLWEGLQRADVVGDTLLRSCRGTEDAVALRRRVLLLSLAANVVLPLAMASGITPLSFATVSLLVLHALDHAARRDDVGDDAASCKSAVRATWSEAVRQYFEALS